MTTRRGRRRVFSDAQRRFLKAFRLSMGNISSAARSAHIGRRTYYNWLNTCPQFAESVKMVKERCVEIAEEALFKNIAQGKEASIIFFLERRGQSLGYS